MTRPCATPKETPWPSVATFFDARSQPGQVPWGRWRHVLNMWTPEDGQLSRMHGWRKYGSGHANSDLHDHLIDQAFGWDQPEEGTARTVSASGFEPTVCGAPRVSVRLEREPFTSGYLHESPAGQRRLFVGSQSRIYSQRADGGWRLLVDNRGGEVTNPAIKWRFAGLLNTVMATNNVDEPLFHVLDQANTGCDAHAFHPAPSLQALGVTAAGGCAKWNNTLFIWNVVQDGVRVSHRVIWCNANAPFEWAAGADNETSAGLQDLDPGITILAALVMQDGLYLFSDKSMWRGGVASDGTITFVRVYHHDKGDGCLVAPDSLVLWRDTALYWGKGTIYAWSPYASAPEVPSWIDRGTKAIEQAKPDCNMIVAGYASGENFDRYFISWPEMKGGLQSKTLGLDLNRQSSSFIDYGMTMVLSAKLKPNIELAWWLVAKGFCTVEGVEELWPVFKEDTRYFAAVGTPVEAPLFSHLTKLVDGMLVEDYTQPAFVPPGGTTICRQITKAELDCSGCPETDIFIFGSPVDFALKQFDVAYFARDEWVNGVLKANGYGLRLASGAMDLGASGTWKRFQNPILHFDAMATDEPRQLKLRVGISEVPRDPIEPKCDIAWVDFDPKSLTCEDVPEGFPNNEMPFPLLVEGRYLYLDFTMDVVTGGAFDIAGLKATISASPQTGG